MDKAQLKYTMMKELKEQLQTNLLQVMSTDELKETVEHIDQHHFANHFLKC